jgi:hypothetical protein
VKCSLRLTVIVLLIAAITGGGAAAAPTVSGSIPFLRLSAYMNKTSGGEPIILETFKTTDPKKHPVVCISSLHDVRYQLITNVGTTVSLHQDLDIVDPGYQDLTFQPGAPDPCKTRKDHVAYRLVNVVRLYPGLAQGSYIK